MSKIPASMTPEPLDQTLLDMQARWHELRRAWVDAGSPDSGPTFHEFTFHDEKLTGYLWKKTEAKIAEDRKLHPKAKRNAPVPEGIQVGEGRVGL